MSLLTDAEIEAAFGLPLAQNAILAVRKVIDAAIKKLAAGVKVEPVAVRHTYDGYGYLYTDSGSGSLWKERAMCQRDAEFIVTLRQLQSAIAAARVQALEEADKVAGPDDSYRDEWFNAKADSSKKIRALIGGKQE